MGRLTDVMQHRRTARHAAPEQPDPLLRAGQLPSRTGAAPRPRRTPVLALAVALLGAAFGLSTGATAQDPTAPGIERLEIDADTIVMSVNEATGLPLKEFIKLTERITGRVITFTETEINVPNAKINFVGTVRLRRESFFAFFQTMLYIQGYAVVIRGADDTEITEIVQMQGPRRNEIATAAKYVPVEELEQYASQTGVQVLTTVTLTHINANNAATATRPFFAQNTTPTGGLLLGNLGDGRSMLLQGFGPQVYAAYQLLRLSDVPPAVPEEETRIVRLENATAEELEPLLKQILEDRNRRVAQGGVGAGGGQIPQGNAQEVQVYAQPSLNALIISGTPERIVEAYDLVTRLDVPIEASASDIQVIELKNVLATDLEQTLRDFLREDRDAQREVTQGGAGAGAVQQRQPRRTVVFAHEESNSLLVSATASNFKQLERMIERLDVRQPQVLIEAALVELTTSDLDRLGFEIGILDIADGEFTRGFGFTSFGLTEFQDTDDDGLPDTRLPNFESPLQGFTGGIIGNDDFAIPVLLNALQNDDRSNILSLPSIVVNNNQSALVKSEENRPTLVQNQGTATTQTGVGDPRTAGIELSISPSISTDEYLRLNVDLTVSRFIGQADPTTGGITISRQVRTQVTLPSGSTMVLGGIIEDQQSESEAGIPFLKDIPILGALFRNSTTENRKTNLYFFLTPTILDEPDFSDLREISQRKKLEASDYIGSRRMRIIDSKWVSTSRLTLDSTETSLEDLDRMGGFDSPAFDRPNSAGTRRGPTGPELEAMDLKRITPAEGPLDRTGGGNGTGTGNGAGGEVPTNGTTGNGGN